MDFEFRQRRERTSIETHFDPWLVRENDLEVAKEEAQGNNNTKTAETISEIFKSMEVGTVLKINDQAFTRSEKTSENVAAVFDALYPDEEMTGLEFFTEEVAEEEDD